MSFLFIPANTKYVMSSQASLCSGTFIYALCSQKAHVEQICTYSRGWSLSMRSWQPGHNSLTSSLLLSWNFEYTRGRGMLSRPMLDSGLFLHVSAVSCLMFCYNSGTKAEEMRQSQIQICKML